MRGEIMGKNNEEQEEHGCSSCYEINNGYHEVANGKKICNECGGTVLFFQEAMDKIADLKSELEDIRDWE